ncbi:MAG: ATP-dependent RecD-like DNA helicase [Bacilli bacterium]
MDKIYGIVKKVIYYDESKAFGIVQIKLDYKDEHLSQFKNVLFDNKISVLSNFDRLPIIDEEYEFVGEFGVSKYGNQFKAKQFKRINEDSLQAVVAYLSSELFPGIGVVTATKIYNKLGSNCLELITNDKTVLNKVKLKEVQKDIIYNGLVKNYQKEKHLLDFLSIGLTMRLGSRVINALGDNAFELVKEDPYILVDTVEGIGFIRADNIAKNFGIELDDPRRIRALIMFVLNDYMFSTGNTFITARELHIRCNRFNNIIYIEKEDFIDYVEQLVKANKLISENDIIFDIRIYNDEKTVATKITTFLNNKFDDYELSLIDDAIDKSMKFSNIEYSNKQYEAIKKSLVEPITVITGGPGTGKSTIIKGIVDCLKLLYKDDKLVEQMYLLAPTGRAAKRLREVTKHDASTIHKFLGYEGGTRFAVNSDNPAHCKVIIIDEFSMVDLSLCARLFTSINYDTRIILVGDADQLPSVGPGNVLRDIIESKEISTVVLDRIHRQASDSYIVNLAHNINHGVLPDDFLMLHHDFVYKKSSDEETMLYIENIVRESLDKGYDLIKDIQVLIPMYKGVVGIEAVNHHLQSKFNNSDVEINEYGRKFKVNDKVIQLVNRSDKGIMNGDIGYVYHISFSEGKFSTLSVMFDNGLVEYEKDDLEDISLAYAISIHKSQGSEFGVVVVPVSFKYYIMLKRKLLYTAITRAKKYLFIVGNYDAIRKGIIQTEDERVTMLVPRIKELLNKQFSSDVSDEEDVSPFDFI